MQEKCARSGLVFLTQKFDRVVLSPTIVHLSKHLAIC